MYECIISFIHAAKTPHQGMLLMVFLGAMAECFFIPSLAFLPDFDQHSLNGRRPATVVCKLIFPLRSPSAASHPAISASCQWDTPAALVSPAMSLSCFSFLTVTECQALVH